MGLKQLKKICQLFKSHNKSDLPVMIIQNGSLADEKCVIGTINTIEQQVFIIDDDEAVRDSMSMLLDTIDLPHRCFASAGEFLDFFDGTQRGCLVLDIRMPGMSGLELQQRLNNANILLQKGSSLVAGADDSLSHLKRYLITTSQNLERASENLNRLIELISDHPSQLFFGDPPVPRKLEPES